MEEAKNSGFPRPFKRPNKAHAKRHYRFIQELEKRGKDSEGEVSKLEDVVGKLSVLSETDSLTGLKNRRKFEDSLRDEVNRSKRTDIPISLLMFDIDDFKRVNDEYGHAEGDKALQAFANLLEKNTRKVDAVGRWGGEEFIAYLYNADLEVAHKTAEHLRQLVSEMKWGDGKNKLTTSIGVSEVDLGGKNIDLDKEIDKTDKALYSAKKLGRNRVEVWTPELEE